MDKNKEILEIAIAFKELKDKDENAFRLLRDIIKGFQKNKDKIDK